RPRARGAASNRGNTSRSRGARTGARAWRSRWRSADPRLPRDRDHRASASLVERAALVVALVERVREPSDYVPAGGVSSVAPLAFGILAQAAFEVGAYECLDVFGAQCGLDTRDESRVAEAVV